MAILPFGLPEPQSETLRRLCQQVREAPGEARSSGRGEGVQHERANPKPPFSAAD
ncbi:hypothetical protein KPZU09_76900 [Klebsiella pneumoniae]|uniref:Uncharacterized protein n=1 Tax=Klebsiella pneumoniae TaxID=573 RepID=A0A919I0D5_KLEPN|nr:hypothetical protein KPZU09_76900 [Klebsiella pneumoniae]